MSCKPRLRLNLLSLIAIYAAAATHVVEASYRLPVAVLFKAGQYVRKAG